MRKFDGCEIGNKNERESKMVSIGCRNDKEVVSRALHALEELKDKASPRVAIGDWLEDSRIYERFGVSRSVPVSKAYSYIKAKDLESFALMLCESVSRLEMMFGQNGKLSDKDIKMVFKEECDSVLLPVPDGFMRVTMVCEQEVLDGKEVVNDDDDYGISRYVMDYPPVGTQVRCVNGSGGFGLGEIVSKKMVMDIFGSELNDCFISNDPYCVLLYGEKPLVSSLSIAATNFLGKRCPSSLDCWHLSLSDLGEGCLSDKAKQTLSEGVFFCKRDNQNKSEPVAFFKGEPAVGIYSYTDVVSLRRFGEKREVDEEKACLDLFGIFDAVSSIFDIDCEEDSCETVFISIPIGSDSRCFKTKGDAEYAGVEVVELKVESFDLEMRDLELRRERLETARVEYAEAQRLAREKEESFQVALEEFRGSCLE